MITVNCYEPNQFDEMEDVWNALSQGPDMTCFQQFQWYRSINMQYLSDAFGPNITAAYFVAEENGVPAMIAPVHVVKHGAAFKGFGVGKGIYLIGTRTHTDYLNFIYKSFSADVFKAILKAVAERFRYSFFYLEQIKKGTALDAYLSQTPSCVQTNEASCVEILPCESFDMYHKNLSKNVRQNLRTAQNRANKDGICFSWRVFTHIDKATADTLFAIYRKRVASKGKSDHASVKTKLIASYYKKVNENLYRRLEKSNYIKSSMQNDLLENMILILYADEKIIGFCYGMRHGAAVSIMIVSFDEDYAKYSPGMLGLFKYIESCYTQSDVPIIDLTRGNEKYKYDLGGTDHYLHYFTIHLKEMIQ